MSLSDTSHLNHIQRLRIVIRGAVQGVGFRPFVYRLAHELHLNGWVNNSAQGVFIEIEGRIEDVDAFLFRIDSEKPPAAFIQSLEHTYLDPEGFNEFVIVESDNTGSKTTVILPDLATCPDCIAELFDPNNRRYKYPFINCTNCGPRYSIIESLPYDRPNTSMKMFQLCDDCRREYEDPTNRRFHAQPNACPVCGPHLAILPPTPLQGKEPPPPPILGQEEDSDSLPLARGGIGRGEDPILTAAQAIRDGKIVALKGIGGFQLMIDARNENAVMELRKRKRREEKPFAVMYPSLEMVHEDCSVSEREERLLRSMEMPIVLLAHHGTRMAPGIAPSSHELGVMLPYSPIHHLLMAELGFPIVATSGNLSDEPICIDEHEAVERLSNIADLFLVHNRPIVRHVDDSVVRIVLDRELVIRRARGYAPLPITLNVDLPPILAVGAHQKCSAAISVGPQAIVSQHIGDLETPQSVNALKHVIADLQGLYDLKPLSVACDLHPDYVSTGIAERMSLPVVHVQHHYAHVLSCMAENHVDGEVLGVAWDGTGYGIDGTIWGGEFIVPQNDGFKRIAHWRPFSLPGSGLAVKEPRRTALGILHEIFGDDVINKDDLAPVASFTKNELNIIKNMLKRSLNSPRTTSVGRIFDAVSSLCNLRHITRHEGQAAVLLEYEAGNAMTDVIYSLDYIDHNGTMEINWEPMIRDIIEDIKNNSPVPVISAKFHNTMASSIVKIAQITGLQKVALSGGCFQSRYLTEKSVTLLKTNGFMPYWHQRIPPNDGGIALGQIIAAMHSITSRS